MTDKTEKRAKKDSTAAEPISLAPLTATEALRGQLAVKPIKGEQVKKAS